MLLKLNCQIGKYNKVLAVNSGPGKVKRVSNKEDISENKNVLPSQGLKIIIPAVCFHLFGMLVLFRANQNTISFNPLFWLLYWFSWWSTHTSLLTILTAVLIFWARKKATTSWFLQFITFLSAVYNLIVFGFCFFYLVSLDTLNLGWENSLLTNLQLISWHFIAPLLVLYHFFCFARMNLLWKKMFRTLVCFLIFPIFYFFYVLTLSRFYNLEKYANFSFHLRKKYPYAIFKWIAEKKAWLPLSFLIAALVFCCLFFLFYWLIRIAKERK